MNSQFPRLPRPPNRLMGSKTNAARSFHKTSIMSGSATSASLQLATVTLNSSLTSAPAHAKDKTHHLKNGRFAPPWPSWSGPPPAKMAKFLFTYKTPETYPGILPVQTPSFLPDRDISGTSLRATWLGHACYLVEFPGGLRVLADPVFSERCSPFSFMGPKRYTPAPCQIKDIPIIDAVIISHVHYDHLDYPTIMQIHKTQPHVQFIVPLKTKEWFVSCKINPDQVTEMDWWEEAMLVLSKSKENDVEVTKEATDSKSDAITAKFACLPSQHMGNRGAFDRGKALWASWSIESGGKQLYFAGDTGYRGVTDNPDGKDDYGPEFDHLPRCPAFKEIGEHYGPFDLGLIPIGAYSPRDIMSPMHSNTMDAVHIFKDTQCKKALAMHWGTWILTDEPVLEPPKQLKESLKRLGLPEEGVFDVCEPGESREFV